MRKLTDNQWEVLMHWLLTLVGGFMGTYAVLLHAGNFGSAQIRQPYGNGGRSDFDGMVEGALRWLHSSFSVSVWYPLIF